MADFTSQSSFVLVNYQCVFDCGIVLSFGDSTLL